MKFINEKHKDFLMRGVRKIKRKFVNVRSLEGLDDDDVYEKLDKLGIKYDKKDTKKKISIFDEGTVLDIDSKTGDNVMLGDTVKLTVSGFNILPMLIVLFVGSITTGLFFARYQSPYITRKYTGYSRDDIVSLTKVAKIPFTKVGHYEYCIKEKGSLKACDWKKTDTKSVVMSENGEWEVVFRGVGLSTKRSVESNKVLVQIDTIPPVLDVYDNYATNNSLKIKVDAHDNVTKKENIRYFYSIDDGEYYGGNEEYEFKNLEANSVHKISIKLIDELGNESEYSYELKTSNKSKEKKTFQLITKSKDSNDNNNNDDKLDEEKDEFKGDEEDLTPPIINLDKLPSQIYYGDDYSFPSFVKFGKIGGRFVCKLEDGVEYLNSKTVSLGKHTVTCTAYSNNGLTKTIHKDFEVIPKEPRDNLVGWIDLVLKYPTDAVELEWMTTDPAYVKSGNGTTNWQEYTGPVLVRVDRTKTIYIKYKVNGVLYVIPPDTKDIDVKIIPDKASILPDQSTKVSLYYTQGVQYVRYKVNGGDWTDYTKPFVAYANDEIEAEVYKEEAQFYSDGSFDQMKPFKNNDYKVIGLITPIDTYSYLNHVPEYVKLPTRKYLSKYNKWGIDLLSNTGFGTHPRGTKECHDENNNPITNVNQLSIGKHKITCEAKAADYPAKGSYAKSTKSVTVLSYIDVDWNWEVEKYKKFLQTTDNDITKWYHVDIDAQSTASSACYLDGDETKPITTTKDIKKGKHSIRCKGWSNQDPTHVYDYTRTWNFEVYDGTVPNVNVKSGVILTNEPDRDIYSCYYGQEGDTSYRRECQCKDQNGNIVNTNSTSILPIGEHTFSCYIRNRAGYQNYNTGIIIKKDPEPVHVYNYFIRDRLPDIGKDGLRQGSNYNIFTYLRVRWGDDPIGTTSCYLDGNENQTVTSISSISEGKHTITCVSTSTNGYKSQPDSWVVNIIGKEQPMIKAKNISLYDISPPQSLLSYYDYGFVSPAAAITSQGIDCKDQNGKPVNDTDDFQLGSTSYTCTITNAAGLSKKDYGVVNKTIYPTPTPSAPTITLSPNNIKTASVDVTITTPVQDRSIEYKLCDTCKYNTYNGTFNITKNNTKITARYVEDSTGLTSYEGSNTIKNITNGPFVSVRYDPDWQDPEVRKKPLYETTAYLSGYDYDGDLEYSFDNFATGPHKYDPRTGVKITQTTYFYYRARDNGGRIYSPLPDLVLLDTVPTPTSNPPTTNGPTTTTSSNLFVNIIVTPSKPTNNTSLSYVDVEIQADSRAQNVFYRFKQTDPWIPYTGKFQLKQNATIYAQATSANYPTGYDQELVDYLNVGAAEPMCTINPNGQRSSTVMVDFNYDKSATKKEYSLDGGITYIQDNGQTFYPNKNMVILLRQETPDEVFNTECIVDNYDPPATIVTLDKGMYYILQFNYPSFAVPGSESYQWKQEGFKKYDSKGVLLIKKEYDSLFKQNLNGGFYEVEDDNGNLVKFSQDHTYLLDVPASKISEYMELKWDTATPTDPVISTSPNNVFTKKVTATISYDNTGVENLYRTMDSKGNLSDWILYKPGDKIEITDNNTTILARTKNAGGVYSKAAKVLVKNVDTTKPKIDGEGDLTNTRRTINLKLSGTDNTNRITKVSYKKGKYKESDFGLLDRYYQNNTIVQITDNGIYTLYVEDEAGNKNVEYLEVKNIDRQLPNIVATFSNPNPSNSNLVSSIDVEIEYDDSVTKEYSFDNNTWKTYNGKFTIKSEDVKKYLNSNNQVVLYSKGTDNLGNTNTVSDTLSMLDFNYPASPVIFHGGYPTLTEYGVKIDYDISIGYDNSRNDLDNYYCVKDCDNDSNWILYNGKFKIDETVTEIKAKSIVKDSKIETSSVSSITSPSDQLPAAAYDGNTETGFQANTSGHIIYVSKKLYNQAIYITASGSYVNSYNNRDTYADFYNDNNELLSSVKISSNGVQTKEITIPENTHHIVCRATYNHYASPSYFYEIRIKNDPTINIDEKAYPLLTEYGIEQGYSIVSIDYHYTAVKKLYKIDNGEWKEYNSKDIIRLELNETIYAKQIDKYGVESPISSYTSILPSDAVGVEAYDGNINTAISGSPEKKIYVDSSMYNKKVKFVSTGDGRLDKDYRYNSKIKIYNLNNELISEQNLAYTSQAVNIVTIPNNTLYIVTTGNWGYYTRPSFHEISVYDVLDITESYINPSLSMKGYTPGSKKIHFEGYNTNNTVEYSTDKINWYSTNNQDVTANYNTRYYFRELDNDGVTIRGGKYKLKNYDTFGNEIYDNNIDTFNDSSKWGGKIHRIDLNQDAINNKLIFNITNSDTTPGAVKFYDSSDNELISYTITASGVHSLFIPNNTAYVTFDSSTIKYNEISVGEMDNFVAYPSIGVTNSNRWYYEKTITIDYPDGYTNEYSLDNGETWNTYEGPIVITDTTNIIARTLLDGEVISTSSSQITLVDNTEPTIEFDDVVPVGEDIEPKVTFNKKKSGGSYVCSIDGNDTYDTSAFEVDSIHNVTCTVTTGAGKTASLTKDVTFIDKVISADNVIYNDKTLKEALDELYELLS